MTTIIIWGCIAASFVAAIAATAVVKTCGMAKSGKAFSFDNDSVHPASKR